MPNKYPGEKLFQGFNVYETRMSIEKLFRNAKMKDLVKPDCQCALDDDKVNEMGVEYQTRPELFRAKNKLIVVDLNDTWYLVDGQHRYEMMKREFERNNEIKEQMQIVWYKFYNEEDVQLLFNSINKDSIKNQMWINVDNYKMIKINQFITLLKRHYCEYFSKTKSVNGHIKAVEELKSDLNSAGFFDIPQLASLTSNELFEYFITRNDEFSELINYKQNITYNESIFYEKEKPSLIDNIVFTLKNNNFVNWLCNDNVTQVVHYYKREKKKIPQPMRNSVWRKYYGDAEVGQCPISFCCNEISRTNKPGMHCGHIVSEKNGGETNVNNLRPICKKCNFEMSHLNWLDFDDSSSCTLVNSYLQGETK